MKASHAGHLEDGRARAAASEVEEEIGRSVHEREGGGWKIGKGVHERSEGEKKIEKGVHERSEAEKKIEKGVRGLFEAARKSAGVSTACLRRRENRQGCPRLV